MCRPNSSIISSLRLLLESVTISKSIGASRAFPRLSLHVRDRAFPYRMKYSTQRMPRAQPVASVFGPARQRIAPIRLQ